MSRVTVRKDIVALRAAAIGRVNATAGTVRARFITAIPGQDMIYLEKAAEARRYLAAYPAPADEPATLDPDPELGYPFLIAEIGITAPSAWALAQVWVQGAALFRQLGSGIETIRLGSVAALEAAASPVEIAAIEQGFAAALASVPEGAP